MEQFRVPIEDGQRPSIAVVDAVAAVTDTPPTDLPPLHDTTPADALNTVFSGNRTGELTFAYAGCDVIVHGSTAVTVSPNCDTACCNGDH